MVFQFIADTHVPSVPLSGADGAEHDRRTRYTWPWLLSDTHREPCGSSATPMGDGEEKRAGDRAPAADNVNALAGLALHANNAPCELIAKPRGLVSAVDHDAVTTPLDAILATTPVEPLLVTT